MKFPEWLYRLLPGDSGSQLLQLLWREATNSSAAATVSCDAFIVPNDKALILTNASMRSNPGVGQSSFRRRLMADPPLGTTRFTIFEDETNIAVNTPVANNWDGEVVIPSGWKVKYECTFDSAVNPNVVELEVFGYLVPRGTMVLA